MVAAAALRLAQFISCEGEWTAALEKHTGYHITRLSQSMSTLLASTCDALYAGSPLHTKYQIQAPNLVSLFLDSSYVDNQMEGCSYYQMDY